MEMTELSSAENETTELPSTDKESTELFSSESETTKLPSTDKKMTDLAVIGKETIYLPNTDNETPPNVYDVVVELPIAYDKSTELHITDEEDTLLTITDKKSAELPGLFDKTIEITQSVVKSQVNDEVDDFTYRHTDTSENSSEDGMSFDYVPRYESDDEEDRFLETFTDHRSTRDVDIKEINDENAEDHNEPCQSSSTTEELIESERKPVPVVVVTDMDALEEWTASTGGSEAEDFKDAHTLQDKTSEDGDVDSCVNTDSDDKSTMLVVDDNNEDPNLHTIQGDTEVSWETVDYTVDDNLKDSDHAHEESDFTVSPSIQEEDEIETGEMLDGNEYIVTEDSAVDEIMDDPEISCHTDDKAMQVTKPDTVTGETKTEYEIENVNIVTLDEAVVKQVSEDAEEFHDAEHSTEGVIETLEENMDDLTEEMIHFDDFRDSAVPVFSPDSSSDNFSQLTDNEKNKSVDSALDSLTDQSELPIKDDQSTLEMFDSEATATDTGLAVITDDSAKIIEYFSTEHDEKLPMLTESEVNYFKIEAASDSDSEIFENADNYEINESDISKGIFIPAQDEQTNVSVELTTNQMQKSEINVLTVEVGDDLNVDNTVLIGDNDSLKSDELEENNGGELILVSLSNKYDGVEASDAVDQILDDEKYNRDSTYEYTEADSVNDQMEQQVDIEMCTDVDDSMQSADLSGVDSQADDQQIMQPSAPADDFSNSNHVSSTEMFLSDVADDSLSEQMVKNSDDNKDTIDSENEGFSDVNQKNLDEIPNAFDLIAGLKEHEDEEVMIQSDVKYSDENKDDLSQEELVVEESHVKESDHIENIYDEDFHKTITDNTVSSDDNINSSGDKFLDAADEKPHETDDEKLQEANEEELEVLEGSVTEVDDDFSDAAADFNILPPDNQSGVSPDEKDLTVSDETHQAENSSDLVDIIASLIQGEDVVVEAGNADNYVAEINEVFNLSNTDEQNENKHGQSQAVGDDGILSDRLDQSNIDKHIDEHIVEDERLTGEHFVEDERLTDEHSGDEFTDAVDDTLNSVAKIDSTLDHQNDNSSDNKSNENDNVTNASDATDAQHDILEDDRFYENVVAIDEEKHSDFAGTVPYEDDASSHEQQPSDDKDDYYADERLKEKEAEAEIVDDSNVTESMEGPTDQYQSIVVVFEKYVHQPNDDSSEREIDIGIADSEALRITEANISGSNKDAVEDNESSQLRDESKTYDNNSAIAVDDVSAVDDSDERRDSSKKMNKDDLELSTQRHVKVEDEFADAPGDIEELSKKPSIITDVSDTDKSLQELFTDSTDKNHAALPDGHELGINISTAVDEASQLESIVDNKNESDTSEPEYKMVPSIIVTQDSTDEYKDVSDGETELFVERNVKMADEFLDAVDEANNSGDANVSDVTRKQDDASSSHKNEELGLISYDVKNNSVDEVHGTIGNRFSRFN